LLFWVGLGLLVVGLFVFITGKTVPAEKKEQSNRFEAFGIKVDVTNPSLILIILGVVMMLAPKMLPQSVKDTELPVPVAEIQESAKPQTEEVSPAGQPEITPPQTAVVDEPQAEPVVTDLPATPAAQTVTPVVEPMQKTQVATVSVLTVKPSAQTGIKPQPVATPQPVVASRTIPVLTILVQADSKREAGINAPAEKYGQQIALELTNLVEQNFAGSNKVKQQSLEDLRNTLQKQEQPFQILCNKTGSNRLLLADLEVPFVLGSGSPSAYWPDIKLHLVDCKTMNKRQRTRRHLTPNVKDSFPFQLAIRSFATDFLDAYGRLLEKP
jgi:hypothetical protein